MESSGSDRLNPTPRIRTCGNRFYTVHKRENTRPKPNRTQQNRSRTRQTSCSRNHVLSESRSTFRRSSGPLCTKRNTRQYTVRLLNHILTPLHEGQRTALHGTAMRVLLAEGNVLLQHRHLVTHLGTHLISVFGYAYKMHAHYTRRMSQLYCKATSQWLQKRPRPLGLLDPTTLPKRPCLCTPRKPTRKRPADPPMAPRKRRVRHSAWILEKLSNGTGDFAVPDFAFNVGRSPAQAPT